MTNTPTTIGIVGLGNIGLLHAERFGTLGASVAGLDSDAKARRRFVERHDGPVFDDRRELFDAVDGVVIAVPNSYHDRYAIPALEAGLDVFLEKPMADTRLNAERIADVAARADGVCTVGFHNRYRAIVGRFEELQGAGRFGELTHVQANYVRRSGVPEHGGWFTREAVAGGGALIDIGVHAIDLALYLLDYPVVEEVVGTTRRSPDHEFDVEDAASGFIRCAGGKTISLEVAWSANGPENKTFLIEGTDGAGKLNPWKERLEIFDAGRGTEIQVDRVDPYLRQARSFVNAIENDVDPAVNTADEALTVQCVIDRMYRSDAGLGRPDGAAIPCIEPAVRAEVADASVDRQA